jgi:hypothetical protein
MAEKKMPRLAVIETLKSFAPDGTILFCLLKTGREDVHRGSRRGEWSPWGQGLRCLKGALRAQRRNRRPDTPTARMRRALRVIGTPGAASRGPALRAAAIIQMVTRAAGGADFDGLAACEGRQSRVARRLKTRGRASRRYRRRVPGSAVERIAHQRVAVAKKCTRI